MLINRNLSAFLEKSRKSILLLGPRQTGKSTLIRALAPADARKLLHSYSITYLKEEIQAESLTRNLEGFSRLIGKFSRWKSKLRAISVRMT